MSAGVGSRPGGVTRRKSSNLLASLGRQNTGSEREKEQRDREAAAAAAVEEMPTANESNSGHYTSSIYSTPRGPSSHPASASMSANPSSSSTIGAPGGSTTPTHGGSSNTLRVEAPNAPTSHNTPSSQSSFGVALENLRYMLQKRIATFSYLKRAHEGKVHWFNTILLQKEELDAVFSQAKMAKRTVRFAVLGMSLSVLLEISAAHDFLRGLLSLLSEFDTVTDENFKARTRNLFKAGSKKRPSGVTDYPLNVQESGDLSYLVSPNIPFDLDYFQVLFTLCDILAEVYSKILSFVGPSSSTGASTFPGFPQPPSSMNNQGTTHIFQNIYPATVSASGVSVNAIPSSDRRQGVGLSPMLLEVVMKIDTRLKKIIILLTKELEGVARTSIKDELVYVSESISRSGTSLESLYQM